MSDPANATKLDKIVEPVISAWRIRRVVRRELPTGEPVISMLAPRARTLFTAQLALQIGREPVHLVTFDRPVDQSWKLPSPHPYVFAAMLSPNCTAADRLRVQLDIVQPPGWWLAWSARKAS